VGGGCVRVCVGGCLCVCVRVWYECLRVYMFVCVRVCV